MVWAGKDLKKILELHCPRLLLAMSSLALDTFRDPGAATAYPCQGLPTLTGNNLFLISNLNLSFYKV